MKFNQYFINHIQTDRAYIKPEWCIEAVKNPDHKLLQADGRMRYYKYIEEVGKFLRVIVLDDGETILNAFYDRRFTLKGH